MIEKEIHRFVQVDAFSRNPFEGNPAAVLAPGPELDSELMQRIAAEMNVSETAFLIENEHTYSLRWFTPTSEVELCGHATLASAHALWNEWGVTGGALVFETRSGRLIARRADGLIWLDFPAEPVVTGDPPAGLLKALGVESVRFSGANRMDLFIELETEIEVARLDPDFAALALQRKRGVIVTALADDATDADFVSRYFAPQNGIPEDPVTGSSHCALGPFWSARLGKTELLGRQLSARGGTVAVVDNGERVFLGGPVVTVLRGEMMF